jgi:glutamate racemase
MGGMGTTKLSAALLILLAVVGMGAGVQYGKTDRPTAGDRLGRFFQKDSVTIVVTDSGLGGLAVTAAVERLLEQHRVFAQVRLVFANSLPDRKHLYNQMESMEEKARVFDSALAGMTRTFQPDLILIACNTLSVVFPWTEFAHSSDVPVIGIVEFGVDQVANALRNDSTASAIILGTPTTIGQNTHAARLAELGFDSNRVETQACDMLESEIQADPTSDIVRSMVEMYADEALERRGDSPKGDLVLALCCSHYGFARGVFGEVFGALSGHPVTIVDPNIAMSESLTPLELRGRYKETGVTVEVVSQAEILAEETEAMAAAVRPVSNATADALIDYSRVAGLFSY